MKIFTDELHTLAWGTDGSFYRINPQKVILAENEQEVADVLSEASSNGTGVTFRAAGTSLSGQAVSDSILLVAGKDWKKYKVSEDHNSITLQPGIVGAEVGRILARYSRRFGPDPASIGSCMVGGIVANNASGMSCGTRENSEEELQSIRIVLSDGTILDTSDPQSRKSFAASHPGFIREIEAIRNEILADSELKERIEYKYSIKNVTGLNILPFVRFSDPFDIIAHLIVGSEGTLAFISEVTMRALPLEPFQASAMVYFSDIKEAARAVVGIKSCPVNAAELLDSRSLASVHDETGKGLTAVLLQTKAQTKKELKENISAISAALDKFNIYCPYEFTDDESKCAGYWKIRSGIFPTVGGMREKGTTCLIEDIAFHIEDLPEATADLSELLDSHGYFDSCIYGHALEGNFHFIINQSFKSEADVARYDNMMKDVIHMVVDKYDGSLKAEHGTGRNMAPFVEYEWGSKAFNVMKRVKKLFDPKGILNPGVIFNDDPQCHLKHFKALPEIKPGEEASDKTAEAFEKINKCIECGFCEVNCVSYGFSLSSRTRIVAMREMERLKNSGEDPRRLKTLQKQYVYYGEETCAGDGLCSTSCPMGINVAELTHEIRRETISNASKAAWTFAADHYPVVKGGLRAALALADAGHSILGPGIMQHICHGLHKAGMPLWTPAFPKRYKQKEKVTPIIENRPKVVYFPSCLNQMMGQSKSSPYKRPLVDETIDLLHKAGYEVIFPKNKESLCCGTLWESKGMPEIADRKVKELEEALIEASENGKYPVLCDQSPCLHRMREHIKSMHLYEPAEFILKFLKDRLQWTSKEDSVILHITCTMRLMGLGDSLKAVAELCSDKVIIPEGVGCCGFAGDKGMTHPELNAHALRNLKGQVEQSGVKVGYSNSRTCEIGLETNSGIPYVSIVFLVNKCTEALPEA